VLELARLASAKPWRSRGGQTGGMYFVYVLKSKTKLKTYVGYTNNISKRLKEHNQGKSSFSKRYKPWILIYLERFKTKKEAIKREKYFKTAAGRRWLKRNLFN